MLRHSCIHTVASVKSSRASSSSSGQVKHSGLIWVPDIRASSPRSHMAFLLVHVMEICLRKRPSDACRPMIAELSEMLRPELFGASTLTKRRGRWD